MDEKLKFLMPESEEHVIFSDVMKGSQLDATVLEACQLAIRSHMTVEFVFNGTTIRVRPGDSSSDITNQWADVRAAGAIA